MALTTMYAGKNNSPQTALGAAISASDTTILVADTSVFPAAPNLATIGNEEDAEVIRYNGISNGTLTGCERGFGGTTASTWPQETVISRQITKYDMDTIKGNIEDLDTRKADASDVYSKTEADALLGDKANTADLGTMAAVDDAASDNKAYGRKDGAWYDLDGRYYTESEMDTKLGDKEDKSALKALAYKDDSGSDNKSYARKNNAWLDITSLLAAVTYIVEGGAGSRNSFYRNVNLGSSYTTAQKNQVSAGTFTDLYLGGYWHDSSQNLDWRIWGFDYFYNRGDTVTSTHHLAIMPDQNLLAADGSTTHYMNDTDTTTGGYKGTKLRSTYLSQCITKFTNFFGKAPLSHRELISNAVSDGKASGWEWVSTQCEVPSEVMMYGSIIWGQSTISNGSGYNIGISYPILPLAQVAPWHVRNGANYWLRDVVSASHFAFVSVTGLANYGSASNSWVGVRPLFLLS